MTAHWFRELHRELTPTDCPKCDEEQIGALATTYGMCTACGAIEVELVNATGTRDLSAIGEHPDYPTGYGCEMCS